jgi:aromatic-L-amino-acid decarboxylase
VATVDRFQMIRDTIERDSRNAPLDLSSEEFRKIGHRLIDDLAEFYQTLPSRAVTRSTTPSAIRAALPPSLPSTGEDPGEVFGETVPLLLRYSLFNGHPRFFGYITSSPAPVGALADLVGAALNPNVGGWDLSPMASEIEKQCVAWIGELLGMPGESGGLLASGGNMANFIGFLAARRAKMGASVREQGVVNDAGRWLVYASTEIHTWLEKACDLFGLGTRSIRAIAVDSERRLDVTRLREQIASDRRDGYRPFLVVGTAGTVSTGAIDPLPELAELAREENLWFHVDGAYGALATLLPDAPRELEGIREADSVAVDPHKWLYAPLEAGCALVRDPATLKDAFSYMPSYYRFNELDGEERTNFYELGLQNSRGFRALKVWMALRQAGREGYERMIGDDIRLAEALFEMASHRSELEPFSQSLSIATFRYVPRGFDRNAEGATTYLNELNEEILARIKRGGEAYLSNAVVDKTFLLRACIVNFRTGIEDVEALVDLTVRTGREVDQSLRS